MKTKRRKIRPAIPGYAHYKELDDCHHFCKNKNNCGNCKRAKIAVANQRKKCKYQNNRDPNSIKDRSIS